MEHTLELAKSKMFDLVASGADLSTFCSLISELVDNPVSLVLPTRTILAHSKNYTKEFMNDFLQSFHSITEEEFENLNTNFDKTFSTGKAGLHIWAFTHYKHMNCGCLYKDNFVAVLDCPIAGKIPDETQMQIFEAAASMIVFLMKEKHLLDEIENQPMQEFMIALLKGNVNIAYQWTFRRDFILHEISAFRLVLMSAKPEHTPTTRQKNQVRNFCARQKNWWCVAQGNDFVILIDDSESGSLARLFENFYEHYQICVSDDFTDLRKLTTHLELCHMTLKFSGSSVEPKQVTYVDDYKSLIAYFYAYFNSEMDIFTNNTIKKIRAYDAEFHTSYLETLRVAIHYNLNTENISKHLNLHKNTVLYRMKQLNNLFDVDLKDIRQLVNYYLILCLEYHNFNAEKGDFR